MMQLPAWYEVVRLHSDVESGELARSVFAIDFGGVMRNDHSVPAIYRHPFTFWKATYLTGSMRSLIEEVFQRLSGEPGDRVLQLRSPFGGGKSHILVALWHAARDRKTLVQVYPEMANLPEVGPIRVAGFDGEKFDSLVGVEVNGRRVKTLWGMLAAQLGCLDVVAQHEETFTPPGGDVVKQMLAGSAVLILMDEVLKYLQRVKTMKVGATTLDKQTMEFIQTLTTEVAGTKNAVMVYSLQWSEREAFEDRRLLDMLDHLASRVDAKREPVKGDEILHVIKRRLLAEEPPEETAQKVAEAVAKCIRDWRVSEATEEVSRRIAEDEYPEMLKRLKEAYPFHIALIDLMQERWASLPDFQRTRDALRFLAVVLRRAKERRLRSPLVTAGDVPLEDEKVRNAFFETVVGQSEEFKAVVRHDLTGPNARAKQVDKRLAEQNPALTDVRPATRLATAILLYSFGGVRSGDRDLPPGVTERELLTAILQPNLDPLTAQSTLKQLRDTTLYLHFDGTHYCFKTEANINKLLEDETERVKQDEAMAYIKEQLQRELAAQQAGYIVVWPSKSDEIDDRKDKLVVAYMGLDFVRKPSAEQEQIAKEMLEYCGEAGRHNKRATVLAVPEASQVSGLERGAASLIAIKRLKQKAESYKLTKRQKQQLNEREKTEAALLHEALNKLYQEVWFLQMHNGKVRVVKRTLRRSAVREANLHTRLLEFLVDVEGLVARVLRPHKLVQLLKSHGQRYAELERLRAFYFASLEAPMTLLDAEVLQKAVADGVSEGVFAYTLKRNLPAETDTPTLKPEQVSFKCPISPDEVDLQEGVILLPKCIRQEVPSEPATQPSTPPEVVSPPAETPTPSSVKPGELIRRVVMEMTLDESNIYDAAKAFLNLAQKVGRVKFHVEAESQEGLNPQWFRNAVREPLQELTYDFHCSLG